MPRALLPFVRRERTRHGAVVYYFRRVRNGPRIRLMAAYKSPEFMAAYAALLAGADVPEAAESTPKLARNSLAWLWKQYMGSSAWSQCASATRKQRENIMKHVLASAGDVPFDAVTKKKVFEGRESRQITPAAANNYLKTMRALFQWALEAEHVDVDPTVGVKFLPKSKKGGFTAWTIEDVQLFRAHWPLGTKPRVAFEIFVNTGLRRSDAVRVGRQHVKDGVITMTTFKSENGKQEPVTVYIPILPCLQAALAAGPTGDLCFLGSRLNKPMAKESLGTMFREWCDEAGVLGKSAHGIRKLCASVVADNGASEMELQALFGWVTNEQSLVYTKTANRKRLALAAAYKMIGDGD